MKLAPSARDFTVAGLVMALAAGPIDAQTRANVPWATGESLEYTVKMAGLNSGTGIMQVVGIDTVRGRPAWRLHFNIKGSTPLGLYHVNDSYDSWMDVETLNSLRFKQDLLEGGKKRLRNYEIFPDREIYHQEGKEERASSANPLDDASFFFFVRTLPLDVGQTYTFDKYFNPDANPVVIKVARRDTVDVPAGRFPAIVLQPTIKTNGLFSKNGHAEIWLSDDEHRILLRMDTHFSIITLRLELRKVTYASPPDSSLGIRR
ncbi:MAG: DUF3108 domain-containing protein [Gemmatimonadales bacterium]